MDRLYSIFFFFLGLWVRINANEIYRTKDAGTAREKIPCAKDAAEKIRG